MFAVVAALLLIRQPRLALFAACALLAHGLGGVLKLLVNRSRPDPTLIETVRIETDYSYPSGHVEWVVAFEGFVLYAVFRLTRNAAIRAVATGLWVVHLALTSAGRVDQGLHWPSDILASYLVGAVALLFLIWAYRVSRRLFPRFP
jgi:undecaprenyl-diphosphatase